MLLVKVELELVYFFLTHIATLIPIAVIFNRLQDRRITENINLELMHTSLALISHTLILVLPYSPQTKFSCIENTWKKLFKLNSMVIERNFAQ